MKRTSVLLLLALSVAQLFAAGKQLTGQHAPAMTPALSPADAQKKFVVPDGFEVRLFAAEPDVINPVAMTWDERGRLWVVELFEYPLGAAPGQKGRDRIKILEDTDNDGRADKVTLFADGLNLATGILLGNGGVYLGQAPELLFLQDTNHDDRVDTQKVLLNGFGLEDRHELLNGFTWGPDGWLYLTHGVFTRSKVKIPEASEPGVDVTAAVARYHPRTKEFEVFAEGTSNPWGVDFDETGNAFVSACVIDHLFHMAPGGSYQRQAGAPSNPYAYEILPSIVNHKHHMAAYCGICIYQGDQFPAEYRGRVFMGNIHQNAINHDRLIPKGASFKAEPEKDFLTTTDGWFRPISEQVGPDGALWIGDWCDKYPCYQNAQADPEGVDRERGRIWRVVYVGKEAGKKIATRPDAKMNFAKLRTAEVVKLLEHSNVWQRHTALRVLRDRRSDMALNQSREINWTDSKIELPLPSFDELIWRGTNIDSRLAGLWGKGGSSDLSELEKLLRDPEPAIRKWAASFVGDYLEKQLTAGRMHQKNRALTRAETNHLQKTIALLESAARDEDSTVRLSVATVCRRLVSSSLTVNQNINADAPVGSILATLIQSAAKNNDPLVSYMIWLASEPLLALKPEPGLRWLAENGVTTKPLSETLARKAMRRLCDTGDVNKMNQAVEFFAAVLEKDTALTLASLDGLLEGQRGKAVAPNISTDLLFKKLRNHADANVRSRAERLGALWGDASSIQATVARVTNTSLPVEERTKAIQVVRELKNDAARRALVSVISSDATEPLVIEAIRALGEIGEDTVAEDLLGAWKSFSTTERSAAADVLVTRRRWATALLGAVEAKNIPASDVPLTAVRALSEFKDDFVRKRAAQAIGRIRPANADKQKIIAEKKHMILAGDPDLVAGHEIAKKSCFVCHKLNGEGADIGPDLTGAGRSSLDALLANVIDPNQVIGSGYENVVIETKDERTVSGRLIENSDTRVRLLAAGPKEEVVAKSEIATMRVSELSVMPEGLEQMPDADFRNMIQFILSAPGGEASKSQPAK